MVYIGVYHVSDLYPYAHPVFSIQKMWSAQFDIIVETLTGSEFEVTVTDKDTIGFIKAQIQKHEGWFGLTRITILLHECL